MSIANKKFIEKPTKKLSESHLKVNFLQKSYDLKGAIFWINFGKAE